MPLHNSHALDSVAHAHSNNDGFPTARILITNKQVCISPMSALPSGDDSVSSRSTPIMGTYLQGEVDVTGGVNQVQTVAIPLAGGSGRGNGNTTLLLLDHPVHGSGTLVDLTNLVGLASVVQDTLTGGGLHNITTTKS